MPILARTATATTEPEPGAYEQAGREIDTLVAAQQASIDALTTHSQELAAQILPPILTTLKLSAGQAEFGWEAVAGSVNYASGRDGTDTKGNGPVFFLESAAARRRVHIWVVPGKTYTYTVVALPSGRLGRQTFIGI